MKDIGDVSRDVGLRFKVLLRVRLFQPPHQRVFTLLVHIFQFVGVLLLGDIAQKFLNISIICSDVVSEVVFDESASFIKNTLLLTAHEYHVP